MAVDNDIQAIYRLSPRQQTLLAPSHKEDNLGAHCRQYHCRLTGNIDLPRFQQAWRQLFAHCDILRTGLSPDNRHAPLQLVYRQIDLPWRYLDWQQQTPAGQQAAWQSLLQQDRQQGFELTRAPLMRLQLICLAPGNYRFLWSYHPLLLDSQSRRRLLLQVSEFYRGTYDLIRQPPAPRFADFIRWLDSSNCVPQSPRQPGTAQTRCFWRRYLAGCHPASVLVATAPRSAIAELNARQFNLSPDTSERLRSHALRHRLHPDTLVIGAWALLLKHHARARGQIGEDQLFGTLFGGRPALPGIDEAIGPFANPLPVRIRVPTNTDIASWLNGLQHNLQALRQFQYTSLAEIREWCELPENPPLFDTLVIVEAPERSAPHPESPPWQEEQCCEYHGCPLTLVITLAEQWQLRAIHDKRLISADCADRLLAQLQHLLVQMSHSLQSPIGSLALMPHSERHRQLYRWNQTSHRFDDALAIHQLFERQARQNPSQLALIDEHQALSYRELNQRANQLARHLCASDLLPGAPGQVPVVLFLDNSIEAVIALFAVFKTGAACLPLDPGLPTARLNETLEQLNAPSLLILTCLPLRQQLPQRANDRIFCLDCEQRTLIRATDTDLPPTAGPDNLAAVIGASTAADPARAVMLTHRNLLNAIQARQHYYARQQAAPLTRLLQLAPLATVRALTALLWPLCTGATLILPPTQLAQQPATLGQLVRERRISHLLCAPDDYQSLLAGSQGDRLADLAAVLLAGEQPAASLIARHQQQLPGIPLCYEYGPNEATALATIARLDDDDASPDLIGRPVANTRVYLLNARRQPVITGATGEIYIGGDNLASKYWPQKGEPRQAFVDDPFAEAVNGQPAVPARLYKTGELARYRDDGQLEWLGRVNKASDCRGLPLVSADLGAWLRQHPAILDATVLRMHPQTPDRARLAQWLAALPEEKADALLARASTRQPDSPATSRNPGIDISS